MAQQHIRRADPVIRSRPDRRGSATRWLALAVAAALAACGSDDPPPRGELIQSADVATLPAAAIDLSTAASGLQLLSGAARCDVTVKSLGYHTVGPKGETDVKATGAVLVPGGAGCPGPYPLVGYAHGTSTLKGRTLASATDGETALITAMLAAQGYVVVAPDYLGYGGSTFGYHPYLHADSQATTVIDALRATRSLLANAGVALNGRVLLTGYSQGGHVSMATQRAIERDHAAEFNLVAGGHMSGPYNLAGSFVGGLAFLPDGTGGSTIFTPFALTGYQKIYGDLYTSATDYFKAPYATGIESLLPGTLDTTQLITSGKLPQRLGDLVTDKLVADVQNPATGLRRALEANTLLGWTPKAPAVLCGGARDPVVLFRNATDAASAFQARGVTTPVIDVETIPDFASFFPTQLSADQQAAYHGTTVPPLCLRVVRDQLFRDVRG